MACGAAAVASEPEVQPAEASVSEVAPSAVRRPEAAPEAVGFFVRSRANAVVAGAAGVPAARVTRSEPDGMELPDCAKRGSDPAARAREYRIRRRPALARTKCIVGTIWIKILKCQAQAVRKGFYILRPRTVS